jgi:hypothetical protein
MEELIHNVVIVYSDDSKEHFDSVQLTEKGIILCRIVKQLDTGKEKFIPYGFIYKNNVKEVVRE